MSLRKSHCHQRRCRRLTMLPCILTKMRMKRMMALLTLSNRSLPLLSNCHPLISWVVKLANLSTTTSRILSVALRDSCPLLEDQVVRILNSMALVVCLRLVVLVACPLLRELPNRISTSKTTITSRNSEAALAARLRSSRRRSRR